MILQKKEDLLNCTTLKELSQISPRQNILIFDTNQEIGDDLAHLFLQNKYTVTLFSDRQKVTTHDIEDYDLIIFGNNHPDTQNLLILEELLEKFKKKVIVLGDFNSSADKDRLIALGVINFISKNRDLRNIYLEIERTLLAFEKNREFTIFIVESNEKRLFEVEKVLQKQNFQTISGKSAIEFFTMFEHHGDLVLLSSELPGMDYHSVIDTILIDETKKHIPILVTAKEHSTAKYVEALNSGSNDFFSFSDSYEVLISKVKVWIESVKRHYENECSKRILLEYKDAVDLSTIVSKTTPTGIITYVNQSFCSISGYTEEELIGQPHNIIRHPDMPQSAFRDLWETIKDKHPWQGIVKNRKKDGGYYWVDTVIKPIVDDYGNIVEYIAMRNDITEIQDIKENLAKELNIKDENLENALTISKEYERAIDESNILSRTDLEGRIIYANNEFCKASGYSKEELIGNTHRVVRHPETPKSVFRDLWKTIKSGRVWKGRIKNRAKDGSDYYVNSVIFPIRDQENNIIEYMAIRHNISAIVTLHKEIENTQTEVIHTMGEIGESRSKETGFHVKRVAEYSRILAKYYGLSAKECETLANASPMHDIGKVAIPDSILNKPGKLTDEEYNYMKKHAEIGYSVLKNSKRELLQAAAIIAHQHHEKWDGSGYPQGLEKDNIHIYGRITALADVFDALGSDRVYKKAWGDQRIFELFKQERGKHFDPMLIDKFFEHLDEFLSIREKYKETPLKT